jgi:cytoskeletal protein CcmA (bactofilin family)
MSLISRTPTTTSPNTGNALGPGVVIKGTLKVRDALHFNATIDGKIISESLITVAEQAKVTGDISADIVTLYGSVKGNVSATGRAELKAGGELHGDLTARRVEMEEGSTFVGQAKIVSGKG